MFKPLSNPVYTYVTSNTNICFKLQDGHPDFVKKSKIEIWMFKTGAETPEALRLVPRLCLVTLSWKSATDFDICKIQLKVFFMQV